jgi:hypothetical protein
MIYNNEVFTKIIEKDGFIELPNKVSVLYRSNQNSNFVRLALKHINTTLLQIHDVSK